MGEGKNGLCVAIELGARYFTSPVDDVSHEPASAPWWRGFGARAFDVIGECGAEVYLSIGSKDSINIESPHCIPTTLHAAHGHTCGVSMDFSGSTDSLATAAGPVDRRLNPTSNHHCVRALVTRSFHTFRA